MDEPVKQAWQAAIGMLSRREYTCKEITDRLLKREFELDVINSVLKSLQDDGYQSDSRFTEQYIRYRGEKGYGPLRIRMELKEKGVDAELINLSLAETELDWYEIAARVRHKKFKGASASTWEDKMRQARFLNYRGFSQEQINVCLEDGVEEGI